MSHELYRLIRHLKREGIRADPASTTRTERVRALHDAFRWSFNGAHVMLSRGIAALLKEQRHRAGALILCKCQERLLANCSLRQ